MKSRIIGKKQLLSLSLVIALGFSVFVNWYYTNQYTDIEGILQGGKSIPLLNTSHTEDYYLIKYCPLSFIQERMINVYGEDYINQIKNGTSLYDTCKRNIATRVKIISKSKFGNKDFLYHRKPTLGVDYWVEVSHPKLHLTYNYRTDQWLIHGFELGDEYGSNVCHKKIKTKKSLIRHILKKWKLPKGVTIKWRGCFVGDNIIFKTF